MDIVHIVVDPCLIVRVDRYRGIEKRCQQILLHIPYIGRVLLQAIQDILDMQGVQLHEPAFYDLNGLIVSGDPNRLSLGRTGLCQEVQNPFQRFLLRSIALDQDRDLQFFPEISFILCISIVSLRFPSRKERKISLIHISLFIISISWV